MKVSKAIKLLNSFEKKAVKKLNTNAMKYIGVMKLRVFSLAIKGEELSETQSNAILMIKDRI